MLGTRRVGRLSTQPGRPERHWRFPKAAVRRLLGTFSLGWFADVHSRSIGHAPRRTPARLQGLSHPPDLG